MGMIVWAFATFVFQWCEASYCRACRRANSSHHAFIDFVCCCGRIFVASPIRIALFLNLSAARLRQSEIALVLSSEGLFSLFTGCWTVHGTHGAGKFLHACCAKGMAFASVHGERTRPMSHTVLAGMKCLNVDRISSARLCRQKFGLLV